MFTAWNALKEQFAEALGVPRKDWPTRVTNLRASSLFFFLHYLQVESLAGESSPILVINETTQQSFRYRQFMLDVARLVADREPLPDDYLVFPDLEPQNLFEFSPPPIETQEMRSRALDALRTDRCKVLFTSYKACWRLMPDPADYYSRDLILASHRTGKEQGLVTSINRDSLAAALDALGYSHVSTVTSIGEYALRGGLVDIFPNGSDQPVRVDMFGDEIDELSHFDPETQRSTEKISSTKIMGIKGDARLLQSPERQGWLKDKWDEYYRIHEKVLSRSALDRLSDVVKADFQSVTNMEVTARAGWYLGAAASRSHCLWHYLPHGSIALFHEDGFIDSETNSYFRFWANRFQDWLKNGLSFLDLEDFYLIPQGNCLSTAEGLASGRLIAGNLTSDEEITAFPVSSIFAHSFAGPEQSSIRASSVGLDTPPPSKWGTVKIAESVRVLPRIGSHPSDGGSSPQAALDRPISILTQFKSRMRELISEEGLSPEIEHAILPGGFVIPGAAGNSDWTVITDMEIFGDIAEVTETQARRYKKDAVKRTDELSPGDYIVHIDYGIGRFAQLADKEMSGVVKSFVEIEYAERDRLFVPVEQLDRLRKYSFDGSEPQLNHLGRDTWKKTKEKVSKDILELAKKLLSLYRARLHKHGHAYGPATVWQEEFADGFPYRLTEDQVSTWRAVEQDMESDKPMERLICGDVGFGKTEIAMRAAFKACVEEMQVLVLCPTTVLADQHYRTFSRRFKPFPFRIGLLSRFQTKAEQKDTLAKMETGRVDVVIATHRGLSKDVKFKNLGLMVIDEEQRFGVKQKEKLKMRWPDIDVLSMSATPIPRTLHMSLIGLRDISLIETAPVARKPVKTYVGEHDDLMIREAILRELGRNGQIYYLHNKIQDIEKVKEKLERMIPDQRVIVGHGQMKEDRLEEVMHAFSLGAYKLLLATTIIENGLDIPSVNTIIVDNAENLGLAQMHQLRGRVGRGANQAYAYFFHQPNRSLTEEAQGRLHAIYNYAYLGAGYEIAQSDLRIRGAGNLLGEAQSGLAKQVGFEYYCELLARSINNVKELDEVNIEEWQDSPVTNERPGTQIDIPLPSFIPESYVQDPVLRLELLRDIAGISTEDEIDRVRDELGDRFGDVPQEVENLLNVVRLKQSASSLGIERLRYDRNSQQFKLLFFKDEGTWYKRAPLVDSRFGFDAHGNETSLDLPFEGPQTAGELLDAIEGLAAARG